MKRICFVICLCIFSVLLTFCNPPLRFTHYSTDNGLPNDFVLSMAQDKNGFIWLGTHLGVVRFDGHSFILYHPDPNKSNSISYKHTSRIYADLKGNLWIKFTEHALNRMDIKTGKSYDYLSDSTRATISSLDLHMFFEDNDSTLWILTHEGLNMYDNKEDKIFPVLPQSITSESRPDNDIVSVSDDTLGNIWFFTYNGIGRLNKKTFETTSLGKLLNRPEIDSMEISSMVTDRKSKLWFTTEAKGLFCYNIATDELSNFLNEVQGLYSLYCDSKDNIYVFTNDDNTLYCLQMPYIKGEEYSVNKLFNTTEWLQFLNFNEDKTGNIWISSSHGLVMFNKKTGPVHYKSDPLEASSLSGNVIFFTFVDQTNNLWVSNYRRGIDKADLNQKPFQGYFTDPDQSDNIFTGTNITSVMEDSQNNLWVGGNGKAIIRLNKESNTITPVPLIDYLTFFSALYEDSRGDIWVGNYYWGIYKINPRTLQAQTIEFLESGEVKEHIGAVRKFVEDKEGNIWFASYTGVYKWERKTGKTIPYSSLYDKHTSGHGFYRTVFIDKDGILWSGSYNGGMARYDLETNTVKRYMNIPGDKSSISGNGVYVIYEESDSTFLIGTTMGLNRFNKNKESFSLVKTDKSTYNYSIYTIIPDSLNNYWMATDNGLIRLNKKTHECTFFNKGDGILANEFNTTASCVSKDGDIYLGTPKGLLSFNPSLFRKNPYEAIPTITNLRINNKYIAPGDSLNGRVVLETNIWNTGKLVLNYYENDFALEFSALHYAVPENNKFWYMLEGYKNEWIPTDATRRWASYSGLQPGKYIFRLKAANNDGMLCKPEDEVSLVIIINPPFWKTVWFKILVVLLIAATIIFFVRLRIHRFKQINFTLEQKVYARTLELHEVNVSLEEQQEEISSQKEELSYQKESLEKTNEILRATQEEIIAQNKELDLHRNKLEHLVELRTAELKEALKRAEESDKLKTSFLANISHEIRTPMNAIIGFSSLLREDTLDEPAKKRFLNMVINNSESLLALINDILDLSKIQANQLILHEEWHNLKLICTELYDIFRLDITSKEIKITLNLKKIKNGLLIFTDIIRVKQVISNLLSNAIKFTPKGTVEFGISDASKEITFYVKDSGIGIPENVGDTIFERFYKLEDDHDNLYRGTGLGLAISKSLVDLWGGKLWYESKEKVGTTFYFTHPLKQDTPDAPIKKEKEVSVIPDLQDKTILIAEDEESNYYLMEAFLNKTGATVLWAKNGKEACDMVESHPIDLILMDIKMPLLSGENAAKLIRQRKPDIPIIAQSAYNEARKKTPETEGLYISVITKPIGRMELYRVITNAI